MRKGSHVCALAAATLAVGCSFDQAGVELSPGDDAIDGAVGPGIDGPVDPGIDGPAPTGRFRKSLTVPASRVSGTLTDFPVFVSLTDTDLRDHASDGGADLHFVAGDGQTALDHELQAWDRTTGRLDAWVRLPALGTSGAIFYLRYGAFDDPPGEDPAGVWSNGFVAVWHLEQAPDGANGGVTDSLGDFDATSIGMSAANQVTGAVGRGLLFEGGSDELTFDAPLGGASPHTISAWVDQETTAQNNALVVIGDGACTEARWLHTRFTGGEIATGFYCDDWATTGVDIQDGGWTLVHWTYTAGAESRLYRDGAAAAGPFTHAGTQSTQGAVGHIGNAPGTFGANMGLRGRVDEVRISDVVRPAAWIAAEHANQSAPEGFVVAGVEEPLP